MDVLGLVIVVVARVHDNTTGADLPDRAAAGACTVHKALVDQGFEKIVVGHGIAWASRWTSSSAAPTGRASFRSRSVGG